MTASSQPVAGIGIAHRHREEGERQRDHQNVQHGLLLEMGDWPRHLGPQPIAGIDSWQTRPPGTDRVGPSACDVRKVVSRAVGIRGGFEANPIKNSYRAAAKRDPAAVIRGYASICARPGTTA